jgi:S-formylglutathione hydrolase FrmB
MTNDLHRSLLSLMPLSRTEFSAESAGSDHDVPRRRGSSLHRGRLAVAILRLSLLVVLLVSLWTAARATAQPSVEYLMVPSAAMGRDIPVAFQGGGPHAVILLDAFDAAPDVSNWVSAGNAMNTLAGKGISVAAPAGGAWSLYTDWEQDGSRQWETFLSQELPDWLAANKGLAAGGHAIVGAAQGGTGALMLAEFHPDRYRYAGSLSGFLTPSNTTLNGAITAGLAQFGGVDTRNMWGAAQLGRWKWHDPSVHTQLLVDNGTRLWIFSPGTVTCSNPAAMIGYCDQAQGSNRTFYAQYRAVGGHNAHIDIPVGGQHDWSDWGPQLASMSADLAATIR